MSPCAHAFTPIRRHAAGAALVLLLGIGGCTEPTTSAPFDDVPPPPVILKDAVELAAVVANVINRNMPLIPPSPHRDQLIAALDEAGICLLASAVPAALDALGEARNAVAHLVGLNAPEHAVLVELDAITMEVDALNLRLSRETTR